jgi:8-oxo-dGTP pyrophosphatase MutT (NUDIX family)
LLVRKPGRWDLPKGHVDPGETDLQCALRELEEETGIQAADVEVDPDFRYEIQYTVRDRRYPDEETWKTVVLFLGWLRREVPIRLTEHIGYEWVRWAPPHNIQPETINPLLAELANHVTKP